MKLMGTTAIKNLSLWQTDSRENIGSLLNKNTVSADLWHFYQQLCILHEFYLQSHIKIYDNEQCELACKILTLSFEIYWCLLDVFWRIFTEIILLETIKMCLCSTGIICNC